MELRRVLLSNAREAVQKYLLRERAKFNREAKGSKTLKVGIFSSPTHVTAGVNNLQHLTLLFQCIDTALLKVSATKEDASQLYDLVNNPNECSMNDSAEALLSAKVC